MDRRNFLGTLTTAILGAYMSPEIKLRMLAKARTLGSETYGFFLTDSASGFSPVLNAKPHVRFSVDGGMSKESTNPVHEHGEGIYSVTFTKEELGGMVGDHHLVIHAKADGAMDYIAQYARFDPLH